MLPRKIIQIAVVARDIEPSSNGAGHKYVDPLVIALCDDGTVWSQVYEFLNDPERKSEWIPLKGIPQRDLTDEELK